MLWLEEDSNQYYLPLTEQLGTHMSISELTSFLYVLPR